MKTQQKILQKLGIKQLKPMQEEAILAIQSVNEVVILSPTGSGKTLAFLLPIIATLDHDNPEVQALILVPSRELAIQIEQVAREMGSGFKVNAVYGGRPFSKDKMELNHLPAILVGTPGRVADHFRRGTFVKYEIKTLVLDEFDKSLEVGFEEEMSEIIDSLENVEKKILTSATQAEYLPKFVGIKKPLTINYLADGINQLNVKTIHSLKKDKLETLVDLLSNIGNEPGIIFCNFKDSIERVSEYLDDNHIPHGCFHGNLDQIDRERALIKFRNGTHQIIIATDLAARGLDIPEIKFIIHYHLPTKIQEFTHRNGRTARMGSDGTAYIVQYEKEELPEFITEAHPETVEGEMIFRKNNEIVSEWATIFISGGRKDKISKGDIAGLFIKQGKLSNNQLGVIELKQDCAFAAVHKSKLKQLLQFTDNTRLKKKKVRVYEV